MTYGVPETIVSDNGSQFRAVGFKKLIQQYGVTHVLTAVHALEANASERGNKWSNISKREHAHQLKAG